MFETLRQWRRKQVLKSSAIPDALWREATEALDPDPTALAWQHKTDSELYQTREAWALALYHADEYGPRAVGGDLAATQRLATEINDDAVLTAAEADATADGPDRDELTEAAARYRALAQTYTAQAADMAEEYEARQQWWDEVAPLREADQAAAGELERRQLPAWRDTPTPATGEQLILPTDVPEPAGAEEPGSSPAATQSSAEHEGPGADSESGPAPDLGHSDDSPAVEPDVQEPRASATPEVAQEEPSVDNGAGHSAERDPGAARDAVDDLRRVARESQLRELHQQARVQKGQPHQDRDLDSGYAERAHRDQLAIENERHQHQSGQAEQIHEQVHEYGADYDPYDTDYGYDD